MSVNNRRTRTKSFAGIPRIVMETEDFRQLPGNAVQLLLVLAHQYRGGNNGDLTAAFSVMRKWGFNSKTTLTNARRALERAKMIIKTRTGRFMNPGGVCHLYALAWHNIDECPGKNLEVAPTSTPWRRFSLEKNK